MNNRQTISKSLLIIIALLLMVSCGKDDDKRLTDSKDSALPIEFIRMISATPTILEIPMISAIQTILAIPTMLEIQTTAAIPMIVAMTENGD